MAQQQTNTRFTRRSALRAGAASAVVAALGAAPRGGWAGAPNASADPLEPDAGGWTTWALSSGSELRPPPPPDGGATRSEINTLQALAERRDAAALDQVSYWDTGAPGYRWIGSRSPRGSRMGSRSPRTACWRSSMWPFTTRRLPRGTRSTPIRVCVPAKRTLRSRRRFPTRTAPRIRLSTLLQRARRPRY